MKRIVILCDGTWNSPDMPHPTNVVRLGQALRARDDDGVTQVPVYVEGVGTGRRGVTGLARAADRYLGGAMGLGLMDNVAEAYRHLVFLHDPGDEVYVFGFSRGAFTARSLVGFIRYNGLLTRAELGKLPALVDRYTATFYSRHPRGTPEWAEHRQASNLWRRVENVRGSHVDAADIGRLETIAADPETDAETRAAADAYVEVLSRARQFHVTYLGVWDTVGALGVPGWFTAAPILNRKYQFHDTALSQMVLAARHAVALDERRRSFAPTLWSNLPIRNGGQIGTPYRQRWFAGDHGAVGGGGEIADLSSITLHWLMDGAAEMGLAFDADQSDVIRSEHGPTGPLTNSRTPRGGMVAAAMRKYGRDRDGPSYVDEVAPTARTRWDFETKADAPNGPWPYRPASLDRVARHLEAWRRDRWRG